MSFTARMLLLGSGELGREFVIAAKRLGARVVACDSYSGAPAMQVADHRRMGVALARADNVERARSLAAEAARRIRIVYS